MSNQKRNFGAHYKLTAKPIFLLSKPRSGTTVLSKILEATGSVDYFGEPLNMRDSNNFFSWLQKNLLTEKPSTLDDTHSEFLNFINESLGKSNRKYILFDIKYEQFQHIVKPWTSLGFTGSVLEIASSLEAHVIHLVRKNYVARIISNEIAAATGVYHVEGNKPALDWRDKIYAEKGLIPINLDSFRYSLGNESRDHLWVLHSLKSLHVDFITVTYENLFCATENEERKIEWERILNYLDLQLT